jgi:hypothetical protein
MRISGGLDPETTEQVRFAAPKNYEAQGRAVTVSDYELIVSQQYTNADSVIIWGGEDEIPPQYGKVFVSIKPVDGYVITDTDKSYVVSKILRNYNIVSIIPEFIDPDYTFVIINSKVNFNQANTNNTVGEIQTEAYNAILNFSDLNLDKFNLDFRFSQLSTAIDNCDVSVVSNLTTVQMKKIFAPTLDIATTYNINLYNAIAPGTLTSSSFVVVHDPLLLSPYVNGKSYMLQDDGQGSILMYQQGIGIATSVVRNAGIINYETGQITLTAFMPYQGDADGNVTLIMSPQVNDIIPVRNNILFIKPEDILVTASIAS